MYVISVAAELAGVHPQTLRIYERKGLVEPARTDGGSRRYSDDDVAMLHRIQELTNEGLNLAGVKRILEMEAELERIRAELVEVRRRADAAIDEARRRAEAAIDEAHRQHRRDLVPVQQSVVLYEGQRRPRR
mgnify:CR=1 FL=1